jgi:type I restriction enzyme S subunit
MRPANWAESQIGGVAEIIMGASPPSSSCNQDGVGLPFFQGKAEFGKKYPTAKNYCETPPKSAKAGDILFSVRAPVGEINFASENCGIGRGLSAIRGTSISQHYLYYYLQTIKEQFSILSQGSTFEAINSTELREVCIRYPEFAVQEIVAEILSSVDTAIENNEQLLAKLTDLKKALMQELFTKGIGHKEFKDSPLGKIPKDWELKTISDLAETITSGSRGWAEYYTDEGDIFIRIGNLSREHINFRWDDIKYVNPPNGSEGERTSVRSGDLLISITADLGLIGVVDKDIKNAFVNQHIALVRISNKDCNSRWAGHYLLGPVGQNQIRAANDSGAKAGLNLKNIGSLILPIPSIKEQNQIVKILDNLDNRVHCLKSKVHTLENLKNGLMQDLLSGKVRIKSL